MTIYRLPVVVSATDLTPIPNQLPPKLQCEDFDATGARKPHSPCRQRFESSGGGRYKCGKGCRQGAFLYPRSYKGADKIHHHQGIDIASGHHGATIVSVCDGRVEEAVAKEFVSGVGGYGRTIVIRSETEKRWYLYAHCFEVFVEKGDRVLAGQAIGTVGISDTWKNKETGKTYIFDGSDESRAHLHFEVSESKYFKAQYTAESRPDDFVPGATPKEACRLDPLEELERLGPWGMRQLHIPTGREVNDTVVAGVHDDVESSSLGGYFPLGANNLWHGGVHIDVAPRSTLLAPLDGTIVAARLDPAPDPDRMAFGSTNFIVLRHEIPQGVYDRFQGKASPTTGGGGDDGDKKKKPPSVGKKCTNPPDLVVRAKRRLAELRNPENENKPYYGPDDPARIEDGSCDAELIEAIRAFQWDIPGRTWSIDGKMTVGATTWRALFPEEEDDDDDDPSTPDEPPPPKPDSPRTLWTVLMHLSAETLDGELAKKVPWIADVELAPNADDAEEMEAAKTRDAHAEDVAEAAHPFVGPVPGGSAADIEWVQKRLKRLANYGGEVNGIYDENLEAALRSFQEQRTKYYGKAANQPAPGTVNAVDPKAKKNKSETLAALRKTRRELGLDPAPSVDPVLAHRLAKQGPTGTARVVTDLGVKVKSGDPIWLSGHGRGLDESDELAPRSAVHWEMFTTDPLVMFWPQLDDDSNDLTVDVPMLVESVEIDDGGGGFEQDGLLTPAELVDFYATGRGRSMRLLQCRFRSEWGLEIGPAVARIDELGLDTEGLAEELAPYMWWSEAGDAVPASPIVWHYNPIELVGLYQAFLDGMMPKPRMGSLHVTVVYEDGAPVVGTVKVSANGYEVVKSAWLTGSEGGNAAFDEIAPDSYIVYLDGFEEHAVEVEVPPETTVPVMVFLPGL